MVSLVIAALLAAAPGPDRDAAAHLKAGDAAVAAKDYRAALSAYQDAISAAPDNVEAHVKAGRAYLELGHDSEAVAQWSWALRLDPRSVAAREGLAQARERRAERQPEPPPAPPTAPPPSDEAIARAHYGRGTALVHEGRYEEAARELDESLAVKPGFALALVARGSARMGQGRYLEALADYSAAQQADPSLAAPLFGLAEAWRALGQPKKAAALYRRFAASTAPDARPALRDYSWGAAQMLAPE